jgi:hypothetical protein
MDETSTCRTSEILEGKVARQKDFKAYEANAGRTPSESSVASYSAWASPLEDVNFIFSDLRCDVAYWPKADMC